MSARKNYKVIIEYLKTYVVAGGYKGTTITPLASTELLKVGGKRWSVAASLPRALVLPTSASLENSILLIG